MLKRVALLLAAAAMLHAASPPRRIISTAPSITEVLFALGLGDRLVGVTDFCLHPPEARKIKRIGSWTAINMEAIVAERPDLVVVQRTAVHNGNRFRALNLRTEEVKLDRMADIFNTIEQLGSAAGVPERAAALNASIRKQLADIEGRVAGKTRTSVLYSVGRTAGTLDNLIAVVGNSYIDEAITMAGGRNVVADSKLGYAKISHETILARNPDVIIDMGEHADGAPLTKEQIAREADLWKRYPSLNAVKTRRVHIVSGELPVIPGPRVVDLVRELAVRLHPESFR